MPPSEPFDIQNDVQLRDAVRGETQYDENKLSVENLKTNVNSAKRELALRAGVTSFYDDRGITHALVGLTCAKSKGTVENSPVITKDLGGQNVTFRASDGESLQLSQYEEMVRYGLSNSDTTDSGVQGIELTNTWLNDQQGLSN